MPGTFTFKPIEANLTHNTDLIGRMNPYCTFIVGDTRIKGQICKKGGKHPHWNDTITVPVNSNDAQVVVELMDKDKITHDDSIGSCVLDLHEVQACGQMSKWYPLTYKNKPAGEILMEAVFQPIAGGLISQEEQLHMMKEPTIVEQEIITETNAAHDHAAIVEEQEVIAKHLPEQPAPSTAAHIFTEQRQVIEPHTFVKEVEVVETRAALKEIEVMEPVKVVKDVQFTQAVPVKKQIEVVEPHVVVKEVEVIEPRVVTKTIQVVENVPVIRQVEVIELKNTIQEVETVEPQTFTKQVEVTEYVPVKKAVEVTNPVTVKKAVEFVEPVITTQTITKEVREPVIVNEEVTMSVGPASVVGVSSETYVCKREGEMKVISEEERLKAHIEGSHEHHHHHHHHDKHEKEVISELEKSHEHSHAHKHLDI